MKVLVTLNLRTGHAGAAKTADSLPDSYASANQHTVRTIVKNVPNDVSPKQVIRQLDLLSTYQIGTPKFSRPKYVIDYSELPEFDGINTPNL
jgi:hypothetical protein